MTKHTNFRSNIGDPPIPLLVPDVNPISSSINFLGLPHMINKFISPICPNVETFLAPHLLQHRCFLQETVNKGFEDSLFSIFISL